MKPALSVGAASAAKPVMQTRTVFLQLQESSLPLHHWFRGRGRSYNCLAIARLDAALPRQRKNWLGVSPKRRLNMVVNALGLS